jgi:pyrrolidone-carboxylate peptidase
MSDVWDTKDGPRRVRRDPPTIDDAALAAQGLTDDLEGQVEIVASLMPVSAEEARRAVVKLRHARNDTRLTIAGRAGGSRAVVVERKSPRRAVASARASGERRGRG